MAGRGRGRGGKASMSFSMEQLGLAKGETLPLVLQPPQKFPPLEYKPLPFTITKELNYIIELKRDFVEYMRESKNNVAPIVVKKDIERFSDRYQYLDGSSRKGYESRYDWTRMPHELKSITSKRKATIKDKNIKKKAKVKDVNVEKKLTELENKEVTPESDVEDEGKNENDEDEEEEMNKQVDGEEEEVDEEMDEGTDYVNSYFDNGEDYDDDDDNMDDGPIY